jgi:hypothetical protein
VIVCSLNEVEIYGRRAARGAGMSWGLAEEAGKASRWLAERGLPGVGLLLGLLQANDGRPPASMAPVIGDDRWHALDGDLCPVCSGAALRDRIDMLGHGAEIRMAALAYPLLLAPFLDQSWRSDGDCYEMRWPNVRVVVSVDGVRLECADDSALRSERADEVTLSVATPLEAQTTHFPHIAGVKTPISDWHAMDALARRTYVPASEESRARGAGASRTDND